MLMVGAGLALIAAWRFGRSVETAVELLAMGREGITAAWEELHVRERRDPASSNRGGPPWARGAKQPALPSWAQAAIEAGVGEHSPRAAADALRRHVLTWAAAAIADTAWRHLTS